MPVFVYGYIVIDTTNDSTLDKYPKSIMVVVPLSLSLIGQHFDMLETIWANKRPGKAFLQQFEKKKRQLAPLDKNKKGHFPLKC